MGGHREPEERAGAVGPIETPFESGHSDYLGPPPVQLSEAGGLALERRIGAWWCGLGARRRRLGLLGAGTLAAALLWAATAFWHPVGPPPGPPPAPLPPWPSQAAQVHFVGLVREGGAGSVRFSVRLTVTNTSDQELQVDQVAQPYAGITVSTAQLLPLRVFPGLTQPVWVLMTVQNCSLTPRADRLPFLDVTFSNVRAMQTQSEIIGGSYDDDLFAAIRAACPPASTGSGKSAKPTFSAVP